MSYHQNEKDEWLKQGAAMYLAECDRAEIDTIPPCRDKTG